MIQIKIKDILVCFRAKPYFWETTVCKRMTHVYIEGLLRCQQTYSKIIFLIKNVLSCKDPWIQNIPTTAKRQSVFVEKISTFALFNISCLCVLRLFVGFLYFSQSRSSASCFFISKMYMDNKQGIVYGFLCCLLFPEPTNYMSQQITQM